jgi:hypothetical protein
VCWNPYGSRVRIDILYVTGCPNLAAARARVHEALQDAGLSAVVGEVEIVTEADARRFGMHGSPTILIDGQDPFGLADKPSLACRLYRTADAVEGAPTVAALVEVLSR